MKPPAFRALRLGLALSSAALLVVPILRGHTLPISTLTLVPGDRYLHLELTLNPFELTCWPELDTDRSGRVDPVEWGLQADKVARRIVGALTLRVNGRPVEAEILGMVSDPDSHHIAVRAHFATDARGATVSLESRLSSLTSGSHVTQVNFGTGTRRQAARLDLQSPKVTFEPLEPASAAEPIHD